ncbi:MAG TPA: transglutaminaseTgpA domain-containing protein [Opitutales bacterium]|nr:transglutaminaseTgpA domain-containing protein [Opitutales bacterium]
MRISAVKKRQQLSLQELYQINWFLGVVMALLSVGTVAYLNYSVEFHLFSGVFLLGTALLRPQLTTFVPRIIWQSIPFFLVIIFAVDLHLAREPVPALIRLNLLLVVYRALFFRRKREDLQLIILSLFLIIIVGVTTVSFTFPAQVFLFTAVAMAFLFNVTLLEDSRDELVPKEIWRQFTWRRFFRTIRSSCDSGFLVVAGIAFSSVVFFSVVLFIAIPRFDLNNPIPFLGMNRSSHTGFSEQIRFGDVTNIRNDNSVALRVEVDRENEIPINPYWRMLVLDEYINGGFRLSYGLQYNSRSVQRRQEVQYGDSLIQSSEVPDRENVWTVYLESGIARYLPLTGTFERIRFQDSQNLIYIPYTQVLGMPQVNSSMLVYQVENMEFSGISKDPDFGEYTLDYEWYPELGFGYNHRYSPYPDTTVALPLWPDDIQYLHQLVEEIGEGKPWTAQEFADRATRYLQSRHSYSMSYSTGEGSGDHVVRWLKSGQPGHCEAFAGALLLICRAAGIPARIVTGFQGGAWNAYENYFMVRNSDAHAWVEIFDGRDSWIRVDPTPGAVGGAADDDEEYFATLLTDSSFSAYLDSLRIVWYRKIVSFDQTSQTKLWTRVLDAYGNIQLKERLSRLKERVTNWWKTPWDLRRMANFAGLIAAVGLAGMLITFVVREIRAHFSAPSIDPVRRKSGRMLLLLQNLPPSSENGEEHDQAREELVAELQYLRYGPEANRGDWKDVLRRGRQFVRLRR